MKVLRTERFKELNKKLKTLNDVYVFPIGDVHDGASTAKEKEFLQHLDLAMSMDNSIIYWMGDLMENAGRGSPGRSLAKQVKSAQEQYDWVIETVTPTVPRSVVFHGANHEGRTEIASGIDISKNQARELGIDYAQYGAITHLRIGNQTYNIHSMHGSSGSRLPHTKIKAHKDATAYLHNIDIFFMGHVHYNHAEPCMIKRYNSKNKCLENVIVYRIMTGHFLEWDESYGEEKAYEPLPSGAPIIHLSGTERKIKIMSVEDFL